MTEPLRQSLAREQEAVEAYLSQCLPPESVAPARLHQAMRYAVFAGGKRLRPLLVLYACGACGGENGAALPAAAAMEMIHTYSLVHDDLPAMDNDTLRRGKPTTHVVFGEALAILAGDALLTRGLEILASMPGLEAGRCQAACRTVTAAAGSTGMIGGQVMDLEAEGSSLDREALQDLHRRKTGALIRASVEVGGICAEASDAQMEALDRYGNYLGLAFQIIDDVLDVVGSAESLGKSAGKDQRAGKSTFPSLLGVSASRQEGARLVQEAIDSLDGFPGAADPLRQVARFVGRRNH